MFIIMEEWREIKGFPLYEISNTGVVRRRDNKRLCKVDKPVSRGEGRVYLFFAPKKKRTRSISTLMGDNWRWEWIRELEEGEEARECWGFPGYFITNRGRVWSEHSYRWLAITKTHSYYYSVRVGGKAAKNLPLHTLVGRSFLPEWEDGLLICHRDEELSFPEINFVENLWVGTSSDNNKDAFAKGRNKGRPGHINNPYGRRGKPKEV